MDMKTVDYLDVTLNLNDSTYRPYHTTKPTTYIKIQITHPVLLKKSQYQLKHVCQSYPQMRTFSRNPYRITKML